jgi:glycosyltransferase involved in cell wall biosynthesis
VFVAGERAWQFARQLGVPETKIYRGVYGFDWPAFEGVYENRVAHGPWPRQFLFMGRYVPVKGLEYLLPAYRKYRGMVSDPWPITFCGQGPLKNQIAAEEGAKDLGFVQPADQPEVMQRHGVFVLSSTYEPWGVALAEAMSSGLPAICTEEVGASVDLVRSCHNGLTVPTGDIQGLADGLKWMHDHYDRLPEMGRHAREFASAHSADLWAQRVMRMIEKITPKAI